ncbi:MAG TPA: HipA family kinase [Gemmatimonadaceae bacterium]
MIELPVHTAIRYVQPLREGGSLPAVVDTRDGGMFVTKFRGAGQGVKALIAEIVVALLARELGLPTPEIAMIEVVDAFGRSEPDPEIQDLLRASRGLNFGARYLDGAFNFDGNVASDFISPELAAKIVWLDAFVTNPDRTHRNPNLMVCGRKPYLIDHGAALYAQHNWASVDEARTRAAFPLIKDHVLLLRANDIRAADAELSPIITQEVIRDIVGAVPDDLLEADAIISDFPTASQARERYVDYLVTRVQSPRAFVDETVTAKERAAQTPPRRVMSRR